MCTVCTVVSVWVPRRYVKTFPPSAMFQPLTLRLMAAAEDAAANPDAPQRECYRQAEIQIKVRRGGNCRARQGILHHKVCER